MKHLFLPPKALFFFLFVPFLFTGQVTGQNLLINDGWKFRQGDFADGALPSLDDQEWRTLDLPHDWSVGEPLSPSLASGAGYLPGGVAWYRKMLHIPADKAGQEVSIYFEGISNHSEVFVNGHSLGKRPNGFVSFAYDLNPYAKAGTDALIAVRVDRSKYNDLRWYAGSGIYRNVYVCYANPIHSDRWGLSYHTLELKGNKARLSVSAQVTNHSPNTAKLVVRQELLDRDGQTAAQQKQSLNLPAGQSALASGELNVSDAQTWSLDQPYLYRLKTSIWQNGRLLDEQETPLGIRTTTFDPDKGFALNGQWMKLKGVCIHHDAGVLGSAVPREVWERRLKQLKQVGCNAIRLSHNPQSPDVYDLCDQLGILVIDEAFDEWKYPKRKWVEGWNIGTPGFDGYASSFEEWGERDLHDMIMRDKRHPSIVMWSIGNEVDYPNDPYSHPVLDSATIGQKVFGGYQPDRPNAMELGDIAKRLVKVVKAADDSRPVTAALAGVVMSNFTAYPEALDVDGYNYTEDRYDLDHKTYPKRIIYGSENRQDFAAWKAVRNREFIFGQFLWTGIDYLGESGAWPSRGFYSGLMDLGGFIKPRGYFRMALWADHPVTYLGTYLKRQAGRELSMDAWPVWNYKEGDSVRVVCYTNCSQSQLLLNGQRVGEEKNADEETGIIYWDIPYRPGKLEVVGSDQGKETCRYALHTAGRPYQLRVTADRDTLDKDKGLVHLTVEVLDEQGIVVPIADDNIRCAVEGPAKLLGLEASNNTDMGNYRDNEQRAYHGRLLAYVQSTGKAGPVTIRFSSPWLQDAFINILLQ